MRQGLESSASSSAPRSSGLKLLKREEQFSTSIGLSPSSAPPLPRPEPLPNPRPEQQPESAATGHSIPAYLQRKNPYGRILEHAEHPYRERKPESVGPPSHLGSIEGRPMHPGTSEHTTRRTLPPESIQRVDIAPPIPPLLPLVQPLRPVSVKATKNFFESKIAEAKTKPVLPPLGAIATAKGATVSAKDKDQQRNAYSRNRLKGEEACPART